MPAVVNEVTNSVELPAFYEWSWPDHPDDMNDSDARMRAGRRLPEHLTTRTRLEDAELAVAYGELLEEGKAGIQQTVESGDGLPRETHGHLLEVKQQMAIEIAEARNDLEVGVYATAPVGEMEEPGPVPERWGATDEHFLATWVPSEKMPDTGVEVIRHNEAARTSLHTRVIASCTGSDIDDYGAAWRAAIERGRNIEGRPNAPDVATARAPKNVRTQVQPGATDFSISIEKGAVTASGPIRTDSETAESCDQLYAHVRGTLAAAYGEPQSEAEHAMDALAASIITSRGTNGCGLGWTPPEPERLRAAGLELQRDPSRLPELGTQIDTVEKVFYPPWPGRELTRSTEHTPEKPEDIFDEQRQTYAERHQEWGNEQNERARRIMQDAPAEPPTETPKPAHPPEAPQRREQAPADETAQDSTPSR